MFFSFPRKKRITNKKRKLRIDLKPICVFKKKAINQSKIDMVKLLRVYGGCLGVERR